MKKYYSLLLILLFTCCQNNKNVTILDSDNIANIEIKEYPFGKQKFFDSDKYFVVTNVLYIFTRVLTNFKELGWENNILCSAYF